MVFLERFEGANNRILSCVGEYCCFVVLSDVKMYLFVSPSCDMLEISLEVRCSKSKLFLLMSGNLLANDSFVCFSSKSSISFSPSRSGDMDLCSM